MKATPLNKVALTGADAAHLIGKSSKWLTQLVEQGFVKRTGQLYSPTEVAGGYIRFLLDEQRRASKTVTQSALQQAKAKEINLRIARDDHHIIELDEALGFVDEIIGGLKADLLGLGASVTRDASVRSHIEGRVNDILSRATTRLVQAERVIRKSGQVADADAEADA
jgi:N-methylhydantoinase A/oxoprolinase/acetone carboxylase beta subunit